MPKTTADFKRQLAIELPSSLPALTENVSEEEAKKILKKLARLHKNLVREHGNHEKLLNELKHIREFNKLTYETFTVNSNKLLKEKVELEAACEKKTSNALTLLPVLRKQYALSADVEEKENLLKQIETLTQEKKEAASDLKEFSKTFNFQYKAIEGVDESGYFTKLRMAKGQYTKALELYQRQLHLAKKCGLI